MSYCVSEQELSSAFREALSDRLLQIDERAPIHCVEEFDAVQGRADYVLSPTEEGIVYSDIMKRISEGVGSPACALILSIIAEERTIGLDQLRLRAGLSLSTIERCVNSLEAADLIECGQLNGRINATDSLTIPLLELWGFELKMKNWRRAMVQSLQFQTYCSLSFVVMPLPSPTMLSKIKEVYSRYNIGLITMDHENIETVVRPKPSAHKSRTYYIYAIASYLRRLKE